MPIAKLAIPSNLILQKRIYRKYHEGLVVLEAKYTKAIQAGVSGGVVILCFVVLLNTSNILCVTCFGWTAILILLLGLGALAVRMTAPLIINDALVISAVAGVTAAVINAVGLIAYNVFISILYTSFGPLVTSVICWTPVAFVLGLVVPPIGGGLWYYARLRGIVK